jgi:hypothetical protein
LRALVFAMSQKVNVNVGDISFGEQQLLSATTF